MPHFTWPLVSAPVVVGKCKRLSQFLTICTMTKRVLQSCLDTPLHRLACVINSAYIADQIQSNILEEQGDHPHTSKTIHYTGVKDLKGVIFFPENMLRKSTWSLMYLCVVLDTSSTSMYFWVFQLPHCTNTYS